MLQPRETDLPGLFLVLVVLPLVAYILLGKWSEASKQKERISVLAQIAAEEAFRAEAMAAATVVPLVPVSKPNSGVHECARCFGPATTRCSRCKSVRYCSGKCQIIHWRQVHNQVCQPLDYSSSCTSPKSASNEESVHEQFLFSENLDSRCFESNAEQHGHEKAAFVDTLNSSSSAACMTTDISGITMEKKSTDKRSFRKYNREIIRREESAALELSGETCSTSYDNIPTNEMLIRHKHKRCHPMLRKEEIPAKNNADILCGPISGSFALRSRNDNLKSGSQDEDTCNLKSNCVLVDSKNSAQNGKPLLDMETGLLDGWSLPMSGIASNNGTQKTACFSERSPTKKSNTVKLQSHSPGTRMHKSIKSAVRVSGDQACADTERMSQTTDEWDVSRTGNSSSPHGGNGIVNKGFMKMIGLKRSSKHDRVENSEVNGDRHKKMKMLFPYEEFVKFFQYEAFDLQPRGLINCGNSCYANAVMQCLTSTKPLTIYLLRRSHSRACCAKKWCLMCEFERHVIMLQENGDPLSLSRILSHMWSANCQIGDGSQEDAHEFLRLLVTSMQSICLEGFGGEDVVDPKLQETTFIQHTFGGQLRSKVKCLRCHHESDRYENIMDLTLEIFGWVESLEDALTQFTSPEDLDGENMYRCGSCAAYVRAQKQLAIQEAPNILTIVLKRFQEGSYGKINKCITFPDMLDMIPFMTGADDMPPLYMLYGVVVHLDTMNASFSGHYISYVKDLQGTWFRIDDTQVQQVPLSQVMSEGAYILFYMRSSPRPSRGKATSHQVSSVSKHWMSKAPKSSSDHRQKVAGFQGSLNGNRPPIRESYAKRSSIDFSDAASSDWSIFTSSDDASFTTESTRDSFSTVDYTENTDPISSIFNTFYTPPDYISRNTVSCSRFAGKRAHTRFMEEEKRSVVNSYQPGEPLYRLHRLERVCSSPAETFPCSSNCGLYMKYECDHRDGMNRTSGHCTL